MTSFLGISVTLTSEIFMFLSYFELPSFIYLYVSTYHLSKLAKFFYLQVKYIAFMMGYKYSLVVTAPPGYTIAFSITFQKTAPQAVVITDWSF